MSYYIELPVMLIMYVGWKAFKKTKIVGLDNMDLETDTHTPTEEDKVTTGWRARFKDIRNWIV